MAWIEFHQSLGGHIKLRRLSAALGVPKPQAVGHLAYLWWWALDGCPGGSLEGIPDAVIADVCCWQGSPTTFVDALRSCGWVDPDGKIHDWEVYIGCLLDKRDRDRKRKMELRATSRGRPEDVQRMSSGRPSDICATAQVTTNQPTNLPTNTENAYPVTAANVPDAASNASSMQEAMHQASPKHRFTPPTKPELELYATKLGLPLTEAEAFEDFYASKGWMVGKSKMVSWQRSMSGWYRRWRTQQEEKNQNAANQRSPITVNRNVGTYNEHLDPHQYDQLVK